MERRDALRVIGTAALMPIGAARGALVEETRVGRLKQSVSRWPYSKIPLPELCRACKAMGIVAIDLLQPEDWAGVRDAGLVCSMGYPTKRQDFIPTGFNNPANSTSVYPIAATRESVPSKSRSMRLRTV